MLKLKEIISTIKYCSQNKILVLKVIKLYFIHKFLLIIEYIIINMYKIKILSFKLFPLNKNFKLNFYYSGVIMKF